MFDTQPNKLSETQPTQPKRRGRASFWISLLILLVVIVFGSLAGYGLGISERLDAEKSKLSQQLDEQFAFARQDVEAGRYEIASKRLEWILEKNAAYPGVSDLLVEVQVKLSITPTPVPTPTASITPTPDMRSQETIFAQAQQQILSKDWSGAMDSLDALRKADPTYRAAQVDGMYYIALRNRGVDQILGIGAYEDTNLEGGIYDLTLVERFGPLDSQAESYRTGARMFLQASSFYGINWEQAVYYFGEANRYYPGLRDATDITVSQRYRESLLNYGDLQAELKKEKDRCQALDSWDQANAIAPLDEKYSIKYNNLYSDCYPPTPTIDPASLITPTVEVVPTTEPPTPEPTATQ